MPGRARSFSSRGSTNRTPRRQTSWTAGPGTTVTRSASGSSLYTLSLVPLVEGLTITRIRGEFLVYLLSATTPADGYIGAVGMMIVPDEAAAAGVASVPTPIDDIDHEEWLWYQTFSVKASATIDGTATLSGPSESTTGTGFRASQDSNHNHN